MNHRSQKPDVTRRGAHHDDGQDATQARDPSWFFSHGNEDTRDVLVSRYRTSRGAPEDFASGERVKRQSYEEYRELILSRPRPPARFLQAEDAVRQDKEETPPPPKREGMSLKATFALAALMAVISGSSVGFIASQYSTIKDKAQAVLAGASGPVAEVRTEPARIHTVAATVIPKKQVATATLEVTDVTGQTNSLIPLALRAEPALADQNLLLKISGLPEQAYLTTGRKDADSVWTLSMADLKDLKLMVPSAQQKEIDVAVAAFEKDTGELAAPVKSMTIALSDVTIQPAAAPPPTAVLPAEAPQAGRPSAIPQPASVSMTIAASEQAANRLVLEGDGLMKSGDLARARLNYEKAWASGSGDGALGMARSYDPVVLASLKIKDKDADPSKALEWYGRAASAGKPEARKAMVRLRLKPQ